MDIRRLRPLRGVLPSFGEKSKLGIGAVAGSAESEGEWYDEVLCGVILAPALGRALDTLLLAFRPIRAPPVGGGSCNVCELGREEPRWRCLSGSSSEFSRDMTGAKGGVYDIVDVRDRTRAPRAFAPGMGEWVDRPTEAVGPWACFEGEREAEEWEREEESLGRDEEVGGCVLAPRLLG